MAWLIPRVVLAPLNLLINVAQSATNDSAQLDPEVGDLIEINRIWYKHWAVYIGDGEVVHLVGPRRGLSSSSNSSSSVAGMGEVRIDDLSDVVGSSAKVNNSFSRWTSGIFLAVASTLAAVKPYPPEQIRRRALSQVGPYVYSAFFNNCESFARWCRFGTNISFQALSYVPLP